MRLVFMGTPQFAVQPLQALVEARHDVAGVVTRPDKPSGRGRSVSAPPIKRIADLLGLTLYQPKRVRDAEFIETLRQINPEAIIVAAYGQILPREILSLPVHGCINIHASLLPLYRGAAPINWAIIRGEVQSGNTIMQMDEGMDTGSILMQESVPIEPGDTAGTLSQKLSALGARLITAALPLITAGKIAPLSQDDSKATVAPLLKKTDGLIDWSSSALEIHNRVRGLTPWPGAYTFLDGNVIKILEAEALPGNGEPGLISLKEKDVLDAGAGEGTVRILRIQPAGKKPMAAADFLRGHKTLAGKRFQNTR
ncbi:MAG TPA: methionyl-tRNA formyltransferase [Nitrospiraceae bacterium]|nr:methionyl-tRNA formyltransferase [Nitrospiraceae bacterium]